MSIRVSASNSFNIRDSLKKELYNIHYDAQKTVGEFLSNDYARQRRLDEILNEYITTSERYLTDGAVEYSATVKFFPRIISLLVPETYPVKLLVPMLCPCCGQEWPKEKPIPSGLELIPKEIESIEYTGIIIDCRGLKFNPSLFPKIINEFSEEVYSVNFAQRSSLIENGLVLFTTDEPFNHPRVGYNPLRIHAMGTRGKNFNDIQISSFDAKRIHGSKKNLNLLKECRVAIIYGP